MGPGRQLLMTSVFVLAATGCQGARLTSAHAPGAGVGRATSPTPSPSASPSPSTSLATSPSTSLATSPSTSLVTSPSTSPSGAVPERPAPRSDGPLTQRYYGSGQRGDEGAGRVLTDTRLGGVTQALERRRPETWAAPRRGRTAVQRSRDEADRYGPTSLNNPARGMDPNGGIYVDIPGFVRFLGRLFR